MPSASGARTSLRAAPSTRAAPRFQGYAPYLEGVRGLAALYVVFHHAALQTYDATYDSEQLSVVTNVWLALCDHGDLAVALFIVLSGYCLMLPVVASGRLRDGVLGYLRRRAQRILPSYYAVIALVLMLVWLVPSLQEEDGTRWDLSLPVFDLGVLLSHATLLHNWHVDWIWKVDGPLWSVAVEWQMYLLFPGLVLVFRKLGPRAGALFGAAVGYGLTLLLYQLNAPLSMRTCPWYLGLFSIGMAVAVHVQSPRAPITRARERRRWLVLAGAALILAMLAGRLFPQPLRAAGISASLVIDPLIAAAIGCVLVHCSNAARVGRRTKVQALLESPLLLQLGAFSYSLYLLHDPLLSFANRALLAYGVGAEARVWIGMLAAVPLSIACSYLLYKLVEHRFLPRRPVPVTVQPTWMRPRRESRQPSIRPVMRSTMRPRKVD